MKHAWFCRGTRFALTASTALCWGGLAVAQTPVEGDPVVPANQAAPVPSPAADPPTAADAATTTQPADQLQEIVVTAEKRSTSLQNVPIAVTALSSEALSQAKVDTTSQLAQVTPNLTVAGIYENVLKLTLRGVGSNDFTQNMNPAVATYIDEVYMGLATGQAQQFFDLERVEVLRGPQGTLYGKNATGGAISYFSKQPSTRDFEGGITATYGNYDRVEAEGFVNVPLSEQAAIRFSGQFKDRDGIYRNTFLGIRQRFAESKAGRLQLLLKPNDALTANFKVFASEFDGDLPHRSMIGLLTPGAVPGTFRPLTTAELAAGINGVNIHGTPGRISPYEGENDLYTFDNSTNTGASAHIAYDTGGPTITSITAYERNKRTVRDDPDATAIRQVDNTYSNDSQYISQELRLSGDIGRIDYVIGGHFYREKIEADLNLILFPCTLDPTPCPIITVPGAMALGYPGGTHFGGPPPRGGLPIGFTINTHYKQINRSLAAFADVKFHLNDALTLTGGLRYTTERRKIDATSPNPLLANPSLNHPAFPGYASFQGSETWDDLSGRAVIDYKFGNSLAYASYSRGFRAGNWNGLGFTLPVISSPVDPETLTSYEVGLKSEFFNRRARLNLTGFYYDYEDMQQSVFVGTLSLLQNASKARIKGIEIETMALVTPELTLHMSGGYTDAKYKEFLDSRLGNLAGNTPPYTPEWNATGGFTFEQPINDAVTFEASMDARYQSKIYFHVANFEHLAQDGYTLVNGRVGLDFDNKYSVALWARNLFDKTFRTDGQATGAPFGMHTLIFGEPRMYGITASAKFR
jgi:iron complex outermembrane receptor protein